MNRRLAAAGILLVLAVACGAAIASRVTAGGASPRAAAIIDQLSATDPNAPLIQGLKDELTEAGYRVDYYPPESVTVDLYRNILLDGYNVRCLQW